MITLPEFLDGTTPHCGPETARLFDSTDPREQAKARTICAECPLRPACADHALTTPEEHGTWGGLAAQDRRRLLDPTDRSWLDTQGRVRLPCGTLNALGAHHRYGETCGTCEAAQEARTLAQRRTLLAAAHAAGGTVAGAAIHRRIGEPVCLPCRAAVARRSAVARETRRLGAQQRELATAS
ncbi:WhiB family transcriptional regulator [Streptomyces sp. NPDC003509]